ncbi:MULTISPECIES: ABC transporter permease [Pacificibacter]|uniref:ABC transporter permease n=1 Tax=Pacificibacter TaxID=1042323 RepID=UPI001C08629F|nr:MULTISPECIES: ABC transporter permease [Pacificibacter]MBU2935155.1 ABC transporter permease [Pacificibacter marinus]MDO6615946.1 ABC transporter permease [Pacificibacter sp. 1_MG-2023]
MTMVTEHSGGNTQPSPEPSSVGDQARAAQLKALIEPSAPTGLQKVITILDRFTPFLIFVAVLVVWQAATWIFSIPTFLLPPPTLIVTAGFAVEPAIWGNHIWATFRVATIGFAASILIGIPLAIALANSRFLTRTLYPVLIVIQSTPVVAVAPIIVVTLGAGDLPRVVITFLITFFPIVVSTTTGLMATPEELIELSRSLRAGKSREITQIRLPFALPYIFSALKISVTLSIIGAVVAEFVAANSGLGYFIGLSTSFFKIPQAFAGLIVLVLLSLLMFRTVVWIQTRCAPWSLPKSERH